MADLNNNGIDDSKETPLSDKQNLQALSGDALKAALSGIMANNETTGGPRSNASTSTSTRKTKLTTATARMLLKAAAQDQEYMGTFSSADITDFMNAFNAAQDKSIEKVVTSTSQKVVPGATEEAVVKTAESTARTEYPSAFDPKQFIQDFVWSKISFADEAKIGSKSLGILGQVRGVVDAFQLLGISDTEARAAARQIAMGKKTLASYTVDLQKIAIKEYPQFADRFKLDPTLTTKDIASPIVKMLANTWDMDVKDIKMDNPLVISYLRYAGADGKGQQPSYYDLLLKAKNDPKYDLTKEANETARDAATGLARAFGFGV